ncbi:hypothetical protein [Pseudoxanthomonas sp. X-1]|uniref:hypothetical protein n=1 Tax=Pseudoxanthomonas sp. X-1 TaxID=2571115 RepID=UPI00110AA6BA|nr:hypothetical protein [Pseudoxanthomonas sp. X-1]TMN18469.1 hypothetical protein FF950_14390 [Pseudoxanthomonas sp. X-1]UAY76030.1 hypothetical protein LAJ50_07285 [Pseudoxanthomonas sp. X-1]
MSGGSNNAGKEANRMEKERQARIAATQAAVNNVFNSSGRAADIADVVNATRDYYTDQLNTQKASSDRDLLFSLARGGLIGGSANIDLQRDQNKAYNSGLLDVERRAQGAGSDLQAADQTARANLISLATSGLDSTTAAQQAAAALKTNLASAQSTATANALADGFSNFNTTLKRMQTLSDERRANQAANLSLYGSTGGMYGGYGK